MLDENGRVVGVLVAATLRRGRLHTGAPELLRQVQRETALFGASPRSAPVAEVARHPAALGENATALSDSARIARVYCRVE
jgi:hypothetical protein